MCIGIRMIFKNWDVIDNVISCSLNQSLCTITSRTTQLYSLMRNNLWFSCFKNIDGGSLMMLFGILNRRYQLLQYFNHTIRLELYKINSSYEYLLQRALFENSNFYHRTRISQLIILCYFIVKYETLNSEPSSADIFHMARWVVLQSCG